MARTIDQHMTDAADAFEAGFSSKAAQKRALDAVSRAYEICKRELGDYLLDLPRDEATGEFLNSADKDAYWDRGDYLHNVRDRHLAQYARINRAQDVRAMIDLRDAIKGAAIATVEPASKPLTALKARVEKSLSEIMAQRGAQYLHAIKLGEIFGNLPVSINTHLVHGHKGAVFVRSFYYLDGKLTRLNLILAAMEEIQRRKDAK